MTEVSSGGEQLSPAELDRLAGVAEDEIVGRLEVQLANEVVRMAETKTGFAAHALPHLEAVVSFGNRALALYELQRGPIRPTPHESFGVPHWVVPARRRLETFVARDPEHRSSLLEGIYFSADRQPFVYLHRAMHAASCQPNIANPKIVAAGYSLGYFPVRVREPLRFFDRQVLLLEGFSLNGI